MKTFYRWSVILFAALTLLSNQVPALAAVLPPSAGGDLVLFDFVRGFDLTKVAVQDATVSRTKTASGSALRVATGHRQSWPGVTLRAPAEHWDLSRYGQAVLTL